MPAIWGSQFDQDLIHQELKDTDKANYFSPMGKNEGDEDINNINNIHTVNNDENQLRNRKQSEKEGNEILQEEDKSKEQNKYETINVLNNRLKKLKRILPLLCTLLYIAGVASLAFFPTNMIANTTYVSENALLPSFSELQFSEEYSIKAQRYTTEYLEHLREYQVQNHSIIEGNGIAEDLPPLSQWIADWVEVKLRSIRLSNVYQHKFITKDGREGINTVGILKAARSSGREAIVITSRTLHPLFARKIEGATSSLCLSISLLDYFQRVKWLSKDIIFVASDSVYGDESIKLWLERYHYFYRVDDFELHENLTSTLKKKDLFYRGGEIRGALSLDFYANSFSNLVVVPEGVNGKLPNLDLINAIDRVAGFSENIQTTMRDRFDPVGNFLFSKNSPVPFSDLPPPMANMFVFILHCAIGSPTGDHSWFHTYNIDAVTLKINNENSPSPNSILKFGRVVEGTVRCLSNLVEHFHQSFYLYVLAGMTFRYVSIGQYLITSVLILSPLLGFLFHTMFLSEVNRPYCYLRALCRTFIFQIVGALCYFLFPLFGLFTGMVWITLIILTLIAYRLIKWTDRNLRTYIYGADDDGKRPPVDILLHTSFYPLLFFLTTFSLLNWSFCLITSIVVLPIFLLFKPSDTSLFQNRICYNLMFLISFPMLIFYPLGWFPNLFTFEVSLWIYEHYKLYFSLLYPFLCFIYIPLNLSHFVTSFTNY